MKYLLLCLMILNFSGQSAIAKTAAENTIDGESLSKENYSMVEFVKFDTVENLNRFLEAYENSRLLHEDLTWAISPWDGKTKRNETGVIATEFQIINLYNLPKVKKVVSSSLHQTVPWGIDRVSASRAWLMGYTGKNITVAVIDSGLDLDHPAIKRSLWVNEAEKNGFAGVDDDGNGYVDDIHGYSFIDASSDVTDENGHGSHVSGVISGVDDSEYFVGVAPDAKLMTIKSHDASGLSTKFTVISSLLYAIDNGANVINCSWSGAPEASNYSQILYDVIELAMHKNILVVAAAGNEGRFTDLDPVFPAGYDVPNMISVGSVNRGSDNVSGFSNFGLKSVDIAAPGSAIKSLDHHGSYMRLSGTSMASPHVAGLAALHMERMRFYNKDYDALEVKRILLDTAERVSGTENKIGSGVSVFLLPRYDGNGW